MTQIAEVCAGFLLAVLWMDLMFDVQVRGARADTPLPEPVLASIAGYYRRVTTEAYPMNRLIGLTMLALVVATVSRAIAAPRWWVATGGIGLALAPTALAALRVVPNAVRLGARRDSAEVQSALARAIFRDHVLCFAMIAGLIVLLRAM
jgi:hypothetical protein